MSPTYILIAIDAQGRSRCALTLEPGIPPDFVMPGEIAFIVQPLDVIAMHEHQPSIRNQVEAAQAWMDE